MPRLALLAVLVLTLAACERPTAQVTTSADLADRLREQFAANVGTVSELSVMGAGARADFRVVGDSGQLVPTFSGTDSTRFDDEAAQLLGSYLPNVPGLADALQTGTFVGERRREGRAALVASTTAPEMTGPATDGVTRSARVFVDPETFDILEIEQSARIDTFAQPFTQSVIYEDFRDVDGVRLPYRVLQRNTGQDQQLSASDRNAQRMVTGGRLALQRQQALALPAGPDRDAAVERADRRIRNLESGTYEVVLQIDSVQVTRAEGP